MAADPEGALREARLDPRPWSAGPGTHFAVHSPARSKRLYVRRGSISFNGAWLAAPAGIRISPGFEHSADAGERGVECVEAFQ